MYVPLLVQGGSDKYIVRLKGVVVKLESQGMDVTSARHWSHAYE